MNATVTLTDSALGRLRDEAAKLGISVEELASAILERHAAAPDAVPDADFRRTLETSFRRYDAAYRKLAQ